MSTTESTASPRTTVPGMSESDSVRVISVLQERLVSLIDLQLTLKHIHWNVVGMNFIAIHEMLDPQHAAVQAMTDDAAERIATLGGEPRGTPGAVVELRTWDDYDLNREPSVRHLSALDEVYSGVIEDHRSAQELVADLDPVTEDMLIGQLGDLEQFQWFVRAHLKDASGDVVFRQSESPSEPTGSASNGSRPSRSKPNGSKSNRTATRNGSKATGKSARSKSTHS